MWYKNIAGRFFGLVTKHHHYKLYQTVEQNATVYNRIEVQRKRTSITVSQQLPNQKVAIIIITTVHAAATTSHHSTSTASAVYAYHKNSLTVHRLSSKLSAKVYCVSTCSVSPNSDESRKQSLYLDGDPNRHQNLNVCSLDRCQPSLKISCKSAWKFLCKVANRQTDKQTMTKTYPAWRR